MKTLKQRRLAVISAGVASSAVAAMLGSPTVATAYTGHPDQTEQDWFNRISRLTEAQAHTFRALRMSGLARPEAYEKALEVHPDTTMDDLQDYAKGHLCEHVPAYAKAEEKRARKAARMAARA